MAAWDCKNPMAHDATFPCLLYPWLLCDHPETTDNWDFDLASVESGLAFSADVVGIFYAVVALDAWDHWVDCDGDSDSGIDCGRVDSFCCTKMMTRATVKVALIHGRMIIRPYEYNSSLCQLVGLS